MNRTVNYPFSSKAEEASLAGAVTLDPPSLDEAIIGVTKNDQGEPIFVYDFEELVRCEARDHAQTLSATNPDEDVFALDRAFDWVCFNIIGSISNMGDRAPLVLQRLDRECVADVELSEIMVFDGRLWLRP